MTSKEAVKIKTAISLIWADEGNFEKGLGILCELVGWKNVHEISEVKGNMNVHEWLKRYSKK